MIPIKTINIVDFSFVFFLRSDQKEHYFSLIKTVLYDLPSKSESSKTNNQNGNIRVEGEARHCDVRT